MSPVTMPVTVCHFEVWESIGAFETNVIKSITFKTLFGNEIISKLVWLWLHQQSKQSKVSRIKPILNIVLKHLAVIKRDYMLVKDFSGLGTDQRNMTIRGPTWSG